MNDLKYIEIPVYLQKLMQYVGQFVLKNGNQLDYKNIEKSRRFLEIVLSDRLVKVIKEKVESEYIDIQPNSGG